MRRFPLDEKGRQRLEDAHPALCVFPHASLAGSFYYETRRPRAIQTPLCGKPRALRLHGKRSKSIDSYSRTLRRVANFFDQCPDDLSVDD